MYTGRVLHTDGIPAGTCFQVSPGVVVTAAHVVASVLRDPVIGGAISIDPIAGGDPRPAVLLASDLTHDIAVLRCDPPFESSVPGLVGSEAVRALAEVVISGVSFVPHDQEYRYVPAAGTWQGTTLRVDNTFLARLEVQGVTLGMSGSPVRRISDDHVLGVVSGRYNSVDGWLRDTVWAARTDDLLELLLSIPDLEVSEVLPRDSQIYRVRPTVAAAAPAAAAAVGSNAAAQSADRPREATSSAARSGPKPAFKLMLSRTIATSDSIVSVTMTRDGTRLAIKHHNTVEIYTTDSGRRLCTLPINYGIFSSSGPSEFSPDGRLLATAHYRRKQIDVWDTSTGQRVIVVPANANCMRFGPDGTTLALSNNLSPVRIFALVPGTPELGSFSEDNKSSSHTKCFDYSVDGTTLAGTFSHSVGDAQGYHDEYTTRIWKLNNLEVTGSVRIDDDTGYGALTLSPDGRRLAAQWGGHTAKIWDSTTGELIESGSQSCWMVAFNAHGPLCVSGAAGNGGVAVRELVGGRLIGSINSKRVDGADISESAQMIAVASGKSCAIWRLIE